MIPLSCRLLFAAFLTAGAPFIGRASLQHQLTLADVHDSLLHAEIAALGAYPELEGALPDVRLTEVPLRACSGSQAVLEGADVHVELRRSETQDLQLAVVVDDSLLAIPDASVSGLRADRFCDWDDDLQRILPYCSAARSTDGSRVYVHMLAGEGRKHRLLTWVFEEGRYLFRVDEEAVL